MKDKIGKWLNESYPQKSSVEEGRIYDRVGLRLSDALPETILHEIAPAPQTRRTNNARSRALSMPSCYRHIRQVCVPVYAK